MASRVTYSTVFSQPWQNIYDLINTRANVADPTGQTTRKFVYSREPDVKSLGFAGYPYIVVNGSTAEFSKQTANRKSAQADFAAQIDIVTCDRGFGNADGQGFSQLNSISDDIAETMNSATNRATLQANGLSFSTINASDVVVEEEHNTLIYRRTILVSFKTRMTVSA